MRNLSISKKINLFIWALLFVSACYFVVINAVPMWGRNSNYGYFDNVYDGYGGHVLPSGIPTADNSVNDLIYTLQTDYYKNGNAQEKTGAAFVANTLMMKDAPKDKAEADAMRTISDTEWTQIKNMLLDYESAGLIKWNYWVSCSVFNDVNSYYQGTGSGTNPNDDAYVSSDDDCTGQLVETIYITKFDKTGLAYALKYSCGNPVGYVDLPPMQITPTVSVTPESVLPGQKISWSHGVIMSGVGSADNLKIQYRAYSSESSTTPSSSGPVIDLGAQKAYYGYVAPSDYSEYTALDTDIGKTFCRSTYVIKTLQGLVTYYESEKACATVVSNIASGACRPIIITVQDPNWSGTTGLSYQTRVPGGSPAGGETIRITVRIYKLNSSGQVTGSSVFTKTVGNGDVISDVLLTRNCTSGDKYRVSYTTSSYTYKVTSTYHPRRCTSRDPITGSCLNWREAYTSYSGSRRTDSWTQQIGPCYDYILNPSVNSLSNYQVEVGASVSVVPTIGNASWTKTNLLSFWNTYQTSTKSKSTEWQVSRLKVNPGKSIPVVAMTSSSVAVCDYYKSKGFSNCAAEKTGTGTVFNKNSSPASVLSGPSPLQTIAAVIGDEPAGTKICFAFSVKSVNSEGPAGSNNESATPSDVWSNSATSSVNCVIVVKKPKVQVLGGDVKAGRSFDGVNPVIQNLNILTLNSVKSVDGQLKTFGSWAEYGLFAAGSIKGMASASAFNGGIAATSSGTPQANYSKLTFSNSGATSKCNSTTNGCYSYHKATIPDISASYPAASASRTISGTVKLDDATKFPVSGVYRTSGNVTISGGTIPKGKWIVINAADTNNTITISNNISYSNVKINTINDIPQVVIMAKNIEVGDSVTKIDAWLIAKDGYLNTCQSHRITNLSTSNCSAQLTINGPVMVSTLYLRRTAGSGVGAQSDMPAEIFNLRADAYLWAYARSTGSGRVWTVYTTNVPVRL